MPHSFVPYFPISTKISAYKCFILSFFSSLGTHSLYVRAVAELPQPRFLIPPYLFTTCFSIQVIFLHCAFDPSLYLLAYTQPNSPNCWQIPFFVYIFHQVHIIFLEGFSGGQTSYTLLVITLI
ncbi:hypothetical protein AX16_002714 [Volvariella volvacea WC 439]|nr:hypothetical protein AX16_002714 [Volvariella volvacea WC 439]